MTVLVDTSVWIRFLAGRQPYLTELTQLLSNDKTVGHELVYGELLIGDRGGRTKLLSNYERMLRTTVIPHAEVVTFVRHHKLHGRGVSWIDIHLLASAVVGRFQLWTADAALSALASELGVAYEP